MRQHEIWNARSQSVVISNDLVQKKRYKLTLMEQKVLLYMISKIKPDDSPMTEYVFNIKQFCEVCGLNTKCGTYKQRLAEILLKLAAKPLDIKYENGRLITHWFADAEFDDIKNEFKVSFSRKIAPYLFEIQTFYTLIGELEYILPFESGYALRLYEFLKSIQSLKFKHCYTLEELKDAIDCDKYKNYADFRLYVLEPAMKDINAFTDIQVEYKPIKTGRKITHIEFTIIPVNNDTMIVKRMMNRKKALSSGNE